MLNRNISKNMFLVVSISALCLIYLNSIVCPPVNPTPAAATNHESMNETIENDPVLNLEYNKYLREIVNVLESDPEFKKIIEAASADDIKSGKIAQHLDLVGHNVRTKLDELKRQEIERLRKLISRKVALTNPKPHEIENLLPKHVDHENIETFEVKDLEKLIQRATYDLEEIDKIRREEFKQHEMQKELDRRQKLEKLDPEARKRAEAEFQREIEQRKHHERINHPGSKDQLEEVWKDEDHLEGAFNPHTFFQLRDIDGNGFLDEFELEAIFEHELDKIYNTSDPLYDPAERAEEANRMREHVINEVDKNKDKLISLQEFLDATNNPREFDKNEGWKSVEDEPQFNKQEFDNFSNLHTLHTQPTPSLNQNQNNQNLNVNNQVPSNNQQH